jgi:3-hydroxybutyryl-CoA dehydratase
VSGLIPIKQFTDFAVGQEATLSKTITEHDVYAFAGIIGDFNPLHVNEVYASRTRFGRRIAFGILSGGLISAALTNLGFGCAYLSQNLRFRKPVFIGDTITAIARITQMDPERKRIHASTVCQNQNGEVVVEGEAILKWLPELFPAD